MSAQAAKPKPGKSDVQMPGKLTLDDVRRKAEHVQQAAQDDVKEVSDRVLSNGTTRLVMYAAVGVVVAVGVAYYMGSRGAKRATAKALAAAPPVKHA